MVLRILLVAAAASVAPIAAKHTPAAGSAERRAILDALRPSVEAKFGVPIEFVPNVFCVADGSALIIADPKRKGGGPIPWQHYMSRDEYENGGIDVSAVLRFSRGRWNLVDSAIGATDVWYENLLPRALKNGC